VCDWSAQEADFVDWVFNSSEVLRERASLMDQHEGLTYERDLLRREPFGLRGVEIYLDFFSRSPANSRTVWINPSLINTGLADILASSGSTCEIKPERLAWSKTPIDPTVLIWLI
jgi:hypothetical protein